MCLLLHSFYNGLTETVWHRFIIRGLQLYVKTMWKKKLALVLSWVQALSYAINAFAIPLQYNVKDAPSFKKGYIINIVLIAASHVVFFIGLWLDKYDLKYFPGISGNRHVNEDDILIAPSKSKEAEELDFDIDVEKEIYEIKESSSLETPLKKTHIYYTD